MREEILQGDVGWGDDAGADMIRVLLIGLGDKDGDDATGMLRMLGVLLSDKRSPAQKKAILEAEYGIPMTREIQEGMSDMCNLSELLVDKGIEIGTGKGIGIGIGIGTKKMFVNNLRSLMQNLGCSEDTAMDLLNVPQADRPGVHSKLEASPVGA